MEKNEIIKVTNRDSGTVCYAIPDAGIVRTFRPRESKDITFGELEQLTFQPGGDVILSDFLIIRNEEAAAALLPNVEPEYFYTTEDIKNIMLNGSLDAFLDMLDFAPLSALETVKDLAVDLPLNDVQKREAILKKLEFNVSKAIEIKNAKFDNEADTEEESQKRVRRVSATQLNSEGRRTAAPKYVKVNTSNE